MAQRKKPRYTGPERYVEYREAEGKTIARLRYWHSPADAQAVTVHLTDGTRVHIGLEPLLKVDTEVRQIKDGNLKITKTYRSILGSPVL